MKKLILGLLAASLMSLGLVGGVVDTAKAAPYPGTVATKVRVGSVTTPIRSGRAVRANARVVAASGNAKPSGVARIACAKSGTIKFGKTVGYSAGKRLRLTGPKLYGKGTWVCSVRFNGAGSVHKASKSPRFKVRVR